MTNEELIEYESLKGVNWNKTVDLLREEYNLAKNGGMTRIAKQRKKWYKRAKRNLERFNELQIKHDLHTETTRTNGDMADK